MQKLNERGLFNFIAWAVIISFSSGASAQNPFIMDQFTADPSARVFDGRVYVYPSHDILADESRGRAGWFCMEDYHVFSSADLTTWTDHGVIVSQYQVDWADTASYSMWAPDCIEKNGRYYFYYPSRAKGAGMRRGFSIGVAVSDAPEGPFIPQPEPIENVRGIDPGPFIDKDGQAYLYWSMGELFVARLTENMLELATEPQVVESLPDTGLKEGPYMFERQGIYYMTYPHVQNNIERLEYATGDNPMGPFRVTGVIMDELPTGCWTNHQSIMEFDGQWYLFYHNNLLSPTFDKARSICIDSLSFNHDGTIRKVMPTLRGVGVTGASQKIEIDRYSLSSDTGVLVAFLDTTDTFKGWETILDHMGAWIQYNTVDFGEETYRSVRVRASSPGGGSLHIRLDDAEGPLLSEVLIPAGMDWKTVDSPVKEIPPGIHHLVVVLNGDKPVEVDWIRFTN